MRTETVTKRPFFRIPEAVQEAWDSIQIRFGEEEDFEASTSVKIGRPPQDVQLCLRFQEEVTQRLPEALLPCARVLVALWDESRRVTARLVDRPLEDVQTPGEVQVTGNAGRASWLGRKGATLSAYLILGDQYDLGVGMPRRKAHIIAMKHFALNKVAPGAEFEVEFWSEEAFKAQQLPAKTTVVVVGDADSLAVDTAEELQIRIAIHEHLRGAFANARRLRRANVLQDAIQTDAITQILLMLRSVDLGALPEEAPARRFLKRIREAHPGAPEDIGSWRENQIHGYAQNFCKLTESGRQFT